MNPSAQCKCPHGLCNTVALLQAASLDKLRAMGWEGGCSCSTDFLPEADVGHWIYLGKLTRLDTNLGTCEAHVTLNQEGPRSQAGLINDVDSRREEKQLGASPTR